MPSIQRKPRPRLTKRKPKPVPPTLQQFAAYQAAYDHFNKKLFGGTLKPCLLVFRDGRPAKNGIVAGHFAWDRWENAGGELIHEISLAPILLKRELKDVMGTLVHEMAHQWQQDFGKPQRPGYHDKEWAKKMCEIGLIPTSTGEPGGKMTGQSMTHWIQPDGPFEKAFAAMPETVRLPWVTGANLTKAVPGSEKEKKQKARNKIKYTCPACDANVWGKPDMKIVCGECEEGYEPQDSG
jgi:predicted SprT family Zn-dependent metalloprotease